MGKARLILVFILSCNLAIADNKEDAKKAALDAIFIQSGGKAMLDMAQEKAREKMKTAGIGNALSLGVYSYSIFIKHQIKIKTGSFTFEFTNSSAQASFSYSF